MHQNANQAKAEELQKDYTEFPDVTLPSSDEIKKVLLHQMNSVPGLVSALIKADKSGELAELVNSGALTARQFLILKSLIGEKETDLSIGANRMSVDPLAQNSTHKMRVPQENRNLVPGGQGLAEILGVTKVHSVVMRKNMHTRWHVNQGIESPTCEFCQIEKGQQGLSKASRDKLDPTKP